MNSDNPSVQTLPAWALAWLLIACAWFMPHASGSVETADQETRHHGLAPVRAYSGVNRPIEVLLPEAHGVPGTGLTGGQLPAEVWLMEARSGRLLERRPVPRDVDRVDLSTMFPVLWTVRDPAVLVAQLAVDGRPTGTGVILQPLIEPLAARSGLLGLIERSIEAQRFDVLRDLATLPAERRVRLAQEIDQPPDDPDRGEPSGRVLSGYRLHRDRQVVLETSLGVIVLRLRYDHAPNTAAWFTGLVEGGYYDGTAFHRIVARDREGHPFIAQAGDPTWTGRGGAGMWIDFEASGLEHDFGVVSLARRPDDPNSNGAQFFISLSRAGCARLDGRYVSFAEVVEGGSVLGLLLATPVGPRDPGVPGSPADRPLDPPMIERAWLRDAPAYPERPQRARVEEAVQIER